MPIGAYTSQPLCIFALNDIDHHVKEVLKIKPYERYCDDTVSLFQTKGDAKRFLVAYNIISEKCGLVMKHSAVLSKVGNEGKKNHGRKRKRSSRQKNLLCRMVRDTE